MKKTNDKWYASYSYNSSGSRATKVVEPTEEDTNSWNSYPTEERATDYFKERLDDHVKCILKNIKFYSTNKTLQRRLKKYGNTKALEAIQKAEQLLKEIPSF